ncbi:hypothetical protein BO78DRAFT_415134 [Aspergillus sclerotiicarbonarius CBS 121057]|uniref:EamA domain-containing protein n=1 Tax=Aspergillus sclerotiicarbonarius (strain CBS 121057 / IBT 28362) TaxID=1448318 RepID=A0A319EQN9_ASPSB|nr:hypothetical protein BO78DRAFT_415134 [Aspergillus sclerotiicarbonarius CBS 121057]
MAKWTVKEWADTALSAESAKDTRWRGFWQRHSSVILMAVAQLISSLIAVTAKLLQTSDYEGPLDTRQVLLTMMGVTTVLSWGWMFLTGVPSFGAKNTWLLLNVRGISGVFGIWGFYYSLRSLPLSEATVINFLSPMVAAYASSLAARVPFTRLQHVAIAISILGVVLVCQPWNTADLETAVTSSMSPERMAAVGAALVGVAGGAGGYVVMSVIGQDASPAVTVNHFSTWTVFLTGLSFAITGVDACRMPSAWEWGQLMFLGVFGLLLQMLIATSMQNGGSTRVLNMVYIQVVFALILDAVVWGENPNWVSVVGGGLILGSVVTAAMTRGDQNAWKGSRDADEEEVELMDDQHELSA